MQELVAPRAPVTAPASTKPLAVSPSVQAAPNADPRMERSRPDVLRFAGLVVLLALLLVVFRLFHLEEPIFFVLSCVLFAGFAIHYWLPFRFKEPFWLVLSVAGAYIVLQPVVATALLGMGLLFYLIAASPFRYAVRAGLLIGLFAGLMVLRATNVLDVPRAFWPIFGAIFMFRMMLYLYELRYMKGRPTFREYLSYFFVLPNYYFLLFPVIDFQTLRRTYYQRDIHQIAMQGIEWIARGTIQLLLYRLVYQLKGTIAPESVSSFGSLVSFMILTYLLYLRVSGHFHIIVGMLHLFGYDLPETHRKYLLAHSLSDFWRRINIYWKDFMVKLFYFPAYFKLRKRGEVQAQILATAFVFVATWLLHSYQWFWLKGKFLFTWPDTLFWAILGVLVIVNTLIELKRRRRDKPTGWKVMPVLGLEILCTFALITVLWSMWNSPSMREWFDLLTWWHVHN